MNERCSKCNTKYRIEPSFFYGAMYVSYAVGIAFAVAAFVITNLDISSQFKDNIYSNCVYIGCFYANYYATFQKYLD